MDNNLPRVLVVSHTPFTKSNSMGSTLASYFKEYDCNKLAQFFIKDMQPDIPVCNKYYMVTDSELVQKIKHPFKTKVGRVVTLGEKKDTACDSSSNSPAQKNRAFGLVLRNILWSTKLYNTKRFKQWVKEFNPELILIQPGDFAYIIKIAIKLSKKFNVPLVMHQSEAYYLKPNESRSLIYRIYRHNFNRTLKKAMRRSSFCVYLCDALKKDYDKHFTTPSVVIYKSTDTKIDNEHKDTSAVKFIYGGNLGKKVGRAEPLLEIGKALKKLGYSIDVYTASKGEHLKELNEQNGIIMHDAVPYDELKRLEGESSFIIHIENQSEFHIKDKKYAFSTKIADMLASGKCSIIYGSSQIAGIKYFKENDLGLVIENKDELESKLKDIIEDKSKRDFYIENAKKFAEKNHDPVKNCHRFNEVLKKAFTGDILRVMHVNCVYNSGSTGKITCDLHEYLKENGVYSVFYYGRLNKTKNAGVYKICSEWYSKLNHLFSKITGIMYGGCFFSTNRLLRAIKKERPDIVHLQCINGYFVNIYRLVKYLKNKKIKTVLTLHADFMFTAGCGSCYTCEKYKTGCYSCADYKVQSGSLIFNRTKSGFNKMLKAFCGFNENLVVTAVSPYLTERAASSKILGDKKHITILNGLDTTVFKKRDTEDLRQQLNINDEKIVFHATPYFTDKKGYIKGGSFIIELANKLKDIMFFVAGDYKEGINVPENLILLGKISDQNKLAQFYSMADVTVITSRSETFSMICAESLCCGTPVVGFISGGPETIAIKKYSKFLPYGDIDGMCQAIKNQIEAGKDESISIDAAAVYSKQVFGRNTYDLYEKILKGEK